MAYIRTPFGNAGDRATIPNDVQPDGSVSQTEGFGVDYQLDPATEPAALNIPRDKFNELMYETQAPIQQLQQNGFPLHITAADNGGTAYAYDENSTVRATNGNNYYSLIDGNTDVPPSSNWGLVVYSVPAFVTGDILPWGFSTIRTGGWLWINGTTIGNAASGATQRANADTLTLFTMYWTDYPQSVLPLQDSSGVETARGVSAAADFAANRRLPVPDYRGRALFGRDNMGGAASAGRITTAKSAINGTIIGASGGTESVGLTGNQNGSHVHTGSTASAGDHYHGLGVYDSDFPDISAAGGTGTKANTTNTDSAGTHVHSFTTNSSGLGEDHQNMPPAAILGGWIVKI